MKFLPTGLLVLIVALSLFILLSQQSFAQTPATPSAPSVFQATPQRTESSQRPAASQRTPAKTDDEDEIVRITTNLVQVDAVVTDDKGNQVTNLTADDFEIFEDGRPQKIRNFSFVSNESAGARVTSATSTKPPAQPVRPRPGEARRTIAIVIDDLKMSFESTATTRRAIKEFIDERMMPGDLVAIVRTSKGVGALQQFTSDKQQLYAAIEHVRRTGESTEEILKRCQTSTFSLTLDPTTNLPTEKEAASEFEGFREQSIFSGTLGAINFIVRGLRELPGRKALVLFSDGLFVCPEERMRMENRIEEALRKIADMANRSSVVVYSIDPRGLQTLESAAGGGGPGSGNPVISAARLRSASDAISDSQHSFDPVVYPTGGFSIYNYDDIANALVRVVDDQKGYYLIGYRPSDSTFEPGKGGPRFTSLKVKLKRPGLTVRTRSGFFGFPDTKGRPARQTREEQLSAAIASPFSTGDIDVRLTSLFGNEVDGSFVLSLLHINPAGLTFTTQPDGWQQAVLDVLAITFDADGQIVEQINRTQTVRARGNTYRRIVKSGLVYSLSVPVKKAGAYQLRIAVRDATSGRVGSASQFIEAPDIDKKRLMLSGIAVNEGEAENTANAPGGSATTAEPKEETAYEPQPGPALRRFHQNSSLDYGYVIYNATADSGAPQIKTRITVSRDGQEVLAGQERAFDTKGQLDLRRLKAGGSLSLGKALTPGDYLLKITVVDLLAKGEYSTATQWIDFEIVK